MVGLELGRGTRRVIVEGDVVVGWRIVSAAFLALTEEREITFGT